MLSCTVSVYKLATRERGNSARLDHPGRPQTTGPERTPEAAGLPGRRDRHLRRAQAARCAVTPYTDLSPKWLDSLAFALLHYRASGDLIAEHGLTSALHTATGTLGVPLETGMADVALAIGGRLEGAVPAGSAGLEFRDLET